MPNPIIQAAIEYVKELFRDNAGGHDFGHTMRVYHNALAITKREVGSEFSDGKSDSTDNLLANSDQPCNLNRISLAALLHDVDDSKLFQTENNANARAFLQANHVADEEIEQICSIINSVSFSKNRGKWPESLEAKIVQDADRLDALGAIGIARTFAFGGEHGRTLESSVQHFYDKLLLLKDEINTESAKEMAESRHSFLLQFLQNLEIESAGLFMNDNYTEKSVEGNTGSTSYDDSNNYIIKYAKKEDLPRFMEIFDVARAFMRSTGNMQQWNNSYPAAENLMDDIEKQQLYVIRENGGIHAVFALVIGEDPTYSYIEDGNWISNEPYGTIHRIASDGMIHDVLAKAVKFGMEKIPHLRVDTHEDNKVMQHVVEKSGFQRCGIIYLEDGSPRIAYEKLF